MLDLTKPGIGGGIGAVFGLLLASWVSPDTNSGFALIVAISVLVCSTGGAIISALQRVRAAKKPVSTGVTAAQSRDSEKRKADDFDT